MEGEVVANRDEIQAQIDALTKQLDSEGDDVELWVKDQNGRETKLTGSYAKKWLKNLGLEDDEPQGDEGDPESGKGAPLEPDPQPAGASVWGRGKK
jgi:hypothetical protein